MLYRSLHTAASGMQSYVFDLDVIANNLANAGTTGYKRSRTNFQDMFYQYYRLPGQRDSLGNPTAIGTAAGSGSTVAGTQLQFTQGSLLATGRQLDIAIVGQGFLPVSDGNRTLYTRYGSLSINENGDVVVASADKGRLIDPPINIPPDTTEIAITSEGIVSVLQSGSNTATQVGQLQLVKFVNPEGLIQLGGNMYGASDASGTALIANPGDQGLGTVQQSYLELSNVEPAQELVELIKTQRNVELNSQVIQAADQLLQLVTNLRRY